MIMFRRSGGAQPLGPDDFPHADGVADMAADVVCPYCGAESQIGLDPGSGGAQDYIEDCPVCCRPWRVRVRYDGRGRAGVSLEPEDGFDD